MEKQRGFTLVELMIVIAIIGLLSVVLVPKIGRAKDAAKNAGVEQNMKTVMHEVMLMVDQYMDPAQFQTALVAKLNALVTNPYNGSTLALNWDTNGGAATAVRTHLRSVALGHGQNQDVAFQNVHFLAGRDIRTYVSGSVVVGIGANASGALEGVAIYGYDGVGTPFTTANKLLKVMK